MSLNPRQHRKLIKKMRKIYDLLEKYAPEQEFNLTKLHLLSFNYRIRTNGVTQPDQHAEAFSVAWATQDKKTIQVRDFFASPYTKERVLSLKTVPRS
jgi:hypothetical protein